MKKIVTALGNPELNKELRKIEEFEIVTSDIQYQEGIFEILEEKNVDILILSELLKGEYLLKELIKKIKLKNENIKIILFLEKENNEKIKIAQEEKIEKIFYHHKVSIQEMINLLKNISIETNIEEEIRNIKKLIIENKKTNKIKIIEKIKNIIKQKNEISKKRNVKIISVAGGHGTGKSLISTCLAMQLKNEKKKTLLLDFDLLNQSINTILGKKITPQKLNKKIKKQPEYHPKKIKEFKIKINKYLDFICGSNIIFSKENMNIQKLQYFIEEIKKDYDIILIDSSSESFLDYTKFLFHISDLIIFLTEGNLIEIKKAINLLEIYTKEWNIKKEKINIIFNKYHRNSIDKKILNNIFLEYPILGKIDFNKKYTSWINKNMKNYLLSKKEKKEHKKIIKSILEEKTKLKKVKGNYHGKNKFRNK